MLSSGESTIKYMYFIIFQLEKRNIDLQDECSNMLIGPVVSELQQVKVAQFEDFLKLHISGLWVSDSMQMPYSRPTAVSFSC